MGSYDEPMHQRFEGSFKGTDQTELFFQTWTPDKIRGVFVITHGLAEHSECYHSLAKILAEDGWQVFAWDMRGHGRSEGKRGFAKNISYFIDDLEIFAKLVHRQAKGQNIVFFGHSLGGLVTLRYLQSRAVEYTGLVLSSPCVGLSVTVPAFKEKLAHVALRWLPTLTMYNEIKYTDLTHDAEVIKSYESDSLRHDKISPGIFLSMLENFPLVLEDASKISGPVLMQLSGDDKIVSTEASRTLFDKLPGKKNQLILYPQNYHEIYNDLDREQVVADLKKFIHPFLGA